MATDREDLEVVSAVLQDAVAKIGDIAHLPKERRFAFVANRFVWEDGAKRRLGPFARVRVGVHFDDVDSVRAKSVRLDAKDAVIDILSISFEPDADGVIEAASEAEIPAVPGTVTLTLAAGGVIELKVVSVNCMVQDISDPWRTQSKPQHNQGAA